MIKKSTVSCKTYFDYNTNKGMRFVGWVATLSDSSTIEYLKTDEWDGLINDIKENLDFVAKYEPGVISIIPAAIPHEVNAGDEGLYLFANIDIT